MEMLWLIGILFCLFIFVTGCILPWINRSSIAELRDRIDELQTAINHLSHAAKEPAAATGMAAQQVNPFIRQQRFEPEPNPQPEPSEDIEADAWKETVEPPKQAQTDAPVFVEDAAAPSRTFEQQFGGRAFVWLGGIALALAGIFMVKYSIESGFLTEKIRVILGLIFGIALLGGSHAVRRHPRIADGTRISQALAGAGIADLYGCLFAATTLYHLIPSWLGFGGMMVVTALTLLMSLRYGAPIAMLGLIGGFAAPLLVHGEPNTPLLFGYLYLVFGGLAVIIRRQNWWALSIPATVVAFLWFVLWLFNGFAAADGLWLSLFLLAVSATAIMTTRDVPDHQDTFSPSNCFRYLSLGGSLLLMAAVTGASRFGMLEWDMFGLFSVAAIILAWFDDRTYGFAPWLAMGACAAMMLGWNNADSSVTVAVTLALFGLLFTGSAYLLMTRSKNPLPWAGLCAAGAVIYYLLAYYKLESSFAVTWRGDFLSADGVWAALGFALALFFAAATYRLFSTQSDHALRHQQQAVFAATATGFLSVAFAILLHQEFLPFAIAGQILVLSLINRQTDIPALRYIAQGLTALLGIVMLPQLSDLLAVFFEGFAPNNAAAPHAFHTTTSLLFQFGLPSLMLGASSWLLREEEDDGFIKTLECIAIALFTVMGYYFIGAIFTGPETAFIARGIFTDGLLLVSFGALIIGRVYARPAITMCGFIAGGLAIARIAGFDLLLHNPIWSNQMVGALPVLNGLMLAYGLPALLIIAIKNELTAMGRAEPALACKLAAYILAFIFVSLNVRQFYHGAYLDHGGVANAEVYSYSIAWLMLGVGLLIGGVMRRDSVMRMASLLIMLLTVGKAFLYDASELAGLWRVLSFFGLGMSLLALSWFYSRFVFNVKKQKQV